jgi:hypothetical protein
LPERSDHTADGNPNYIVKGYQSALTQVWVGSNINLPGESAPDISRNSKSIKTDVSVRAIYKSTNVEIFLCTSGGWEGDAAIRAIAGDAGKGAGVGATVAPFINEASAISNK